jgi:hypothetical protein
MAMADEEELSPEQQAELERQQSEFNREESTVDETQAELDAYNEYDSYYSKFKRALRLDGWKLPWGSDTPNEPVVIPKPQWPLSNNMAMGMPPGFLPSTDPGDRYYNGLLTARAPVLSLIPGVPKIKQRRLYFGTEKGELRRIAALANRADSDEEATRSLVTILSTPRGKSSKPPPSLLMYSFKRDFSQYYRYCNLMMGAVSAMMDRPGGANRLKDRYRFRFFDNFDGGGIDQSIGFWIEKASSVSESASNTYQGGDPMEAYRQKTGQMVKGAQYMLGMQNTDPDARVSTVSSILNPTKNIAGKMTGLAGKTMIFQTWENSGYSKDISVAFKFIAPYGDPGSIFEFVYKPFIALLALTLPRQSTGDTYTSPFLLRADCPGWFTCDMGAITSLSYKKGGSEDMWSIDGLPMVIECNITITDMYPVMMQTRNSSLLGSNPALHGFLMNMSGVRVSDPMEVSLAKSRLALASKVQFLDYRTYLDRFGLGIGGIRTNLAENFSGVVGWVQNAFRGFA